MPDRAKSQYPPIRRTKLFRYGPLFTWKSQPRAPFSLPRTKHATAAAYIAALTEEIELSRANRTGASTMRD